MPSRFANLSWRTVFVAALAVFFAAAGMTVRTATPVLAADLSKDEEAVLSALTQYASEAHLTPKTLCGQSDPHPQALPAGAFRLYLAYDGTEANLLSFREFVNSDATQLKSKYDLQLVEFRLSMDCSVPATFSASQQYHALMQFAVRKH